MVLRAIEHKLESLFEGIFGRAFRTNVQPVELARKLAKEMDDHRTVSVSRVYVPNEYTVYLSPADHEQFEAYEESLRDELQEYLAEHARRETLASASWMSQSRERPITTRRSFTSWLLPFQLSVTSSCSTPSSSAEAACVGSGTVFGL